ncbi:hypothetical protein [Agrobacterium tumefaciens]|jgi:hypothetical protein|uniref:hypothetical protein n=1 Tax=Agrobacterium tumefaciens TaxID=358 RepID=UPI00157256DA|nr:hypothetical protein [Agrobacterium tumefaciens]NTD85429.1 hypothetical protein [Agrobacterium tumefaciens]NTD90778.1 hypothetical protein [Agrobacterium tumefaciens]NTD96425.1 hypothetical protein [Agrobacterium tumefaciens]NTE15852.1 hypothetical protein [Agrobacterium tumefaciens]NTE23159.1 hypothetical protein [Agrobacterium tumefaciens]
MQKVNTAVVVTAMQKLDGLLPGNDPETITALTFSLVERGTHAGLSLAEIVHQVELAHRARAEARN